MTSGISFQRDDVELIMFFYDIDKHYQGTLHRNISLSR